MEAVILAAGYATRLYPLTENKPKCLLPVQNRSILDWIVDKLEALPGLSRLVIVTNARFDDQLRSWGDGQKRPFLIEILNDGTTSNDNRLGAIGDFSFAIRKAGLKGEDILLLASDNLFDQDLGAFTTFARAKKAVTTGVYDLGDPRKASRRYGVIESDANGRIAGMEEKPAEPKTSLIGMGIYYFPKESLPKVDEYLADKNAQDAPGYFLRWLLSREDIFSFTFTGMWYDIGDLSALEEAGRLFKPAPSVENNP